MKIFLMFSLLVLSISTLQAQPDIKLLKTNKDFFVKKYQVKKASTFAAEDKKMLTIQKSCVIKEDKISAFYQTSFQYNMKVKIQKKDPYGWGAIILDALGGNYDRNNFSNMFSFK